MDRCSEASLPISRPDPDGPRVGDKSQEARQAGQPQSGVMEDASPTVHRASLLQTVRHGTTGCDSIHQ